MFARSKKLSGSPGRPFMQTGLGESLFVSPKQDWLAWARLTGLATVSLAAAMFFKPTNHTRYSHASKQMINPYNQQPTQEHAKTTQDLKP